VAYDTLSERITSIFEREIRKLVDEIAAIDLRLSQLGDSEEDQIERTLLLALRRHLVNDLRELGGFSGDPYLYEQAIAEEAPSAAVFPVEGEAAG